MKPHERKDEQVVSQTPKKKTYTGKKNAAGSAGLSARPLESSWSSRFFAARAYGLKAYINKQAESSSTTSYSPRGCHPRRVGGNGLRLGHDVCPQSDQRLWQRAEGTLTDLASAWAMGQGDILAVGMTNADLDDTIT